MQNLQRSFYILLFFILIDPVSAQQWQYKAPMPTSRKGMAGVVLNDQIWVIGGAKMEHHALNTVEVFDPISNSWNSQVPSLLKARDNATAQVWQNSIYVFGGRDGHGMISQVEKFDLDSMKWEVVSQIPVPRFGMASVVVDSSIWLIGGTGHQNTFYDKVDIFYPSENRWEQLPAKLNFARGDPMAAILDSIVYVFGGYFYGPLANYESYNKSSQSWVVEGKMLYNCASSGMIQEGNKVYLIGGMGQTGMLKSVQIFQPNAALWSEGSSLNTPRRELFAANVQGNIYAIGGRGPMMNTVYNTVEELDLLVSVHSADSEIPATHLLIDNYPNPFSKQSIVRIILPERDFLQVAVYDLLGREVFRLFEGNLSAGEHSLSISFDSFTGFRLPSGIYFIRVLGKKYSAIRKIQLIR